MGVDLGGTKIEVVVLADDGSEMVRRRVATPNGDYATIVATIAGLVTDVESEVGESCSVGIGTPGAISPFSGRLRNSNTDSFNDMPLDRDLEAALGRQVRLANDANCFALSEAVDGAGAGAQTVFGVILGTGVGGGIVVDGRVLVGPNAIAGEWGHNQMPGEDAENRPCYCGRINCIEQFLSGPALAADIPDVGDVKMTAEDLVRRAEFDEAASAALDLYVTRLGRALAIVINIVDPDVIVLGGGVSNVEVLYELVPQRWAEWVFSDGVATRLAQSHHGDSSGVRGAAWLWPA
jgi:fructokinase